MEINILQLLFDPRLSNIFLLLMVGLLSLYLIAKMKTISALKENIADLTQTIKALDHQAKLIIKSDMELKLYQEEAEDKLNKFTLLKNLILSSVHILDKEKLFSQIDERIINELGFKKGLVVAFNDLSVITNCGFEVYEVDAIKKFLASKREVLRITALLTAESETASSLAASLKLKDFLIAPIRARENIYAIFFLSNLTTSGDIKRGEKEIFSIICMYLGQCLDNIQIFEELYHAKDDLERKIKERTTELIKSLREIETISKMKTDFISSVSHELRTPLTAVKGFSSLLAEEKFGKLPEEAKRRLEKIDENVNKLVEMVNTLLDIAHIESGRMEVKIAPSDIVKLIREVTEFLLPQLQAKEISLGVHTPESLIVYMDKNLIERVLLNLINNAVKFTPQKGTITIGCKLEIDHAVISIADTGYGIEKENLDKIFQEFFRVDNPINRELRGSGLGLSLVKRIIDTHKGNIWVESEIGKGSTFYFSLKI